MTTASSPAIAVSLTPSVIHQTGDGSLSLHAAAVLLLAKDAAEACETTQRIGAIIARLTGIGAGSAVRS